jgi:hypothetical protein
LYSFSKFQFDHIISLKHGGSTVPENLCLSCINCNINKGADVGTVLLASDIFTRFFNPRKDKCGDHFEILSSLILPKTQIAEATIKILDFNHVDRLMERAALVEAGLFPHSDALLII